MHLINRLIIIFSVIFSLSGCFWQEQLLTQWEVAPEGATSMGLSENGRFVIYYSESQHIVLWDTQTNKELANFGVNDPEKNSVILSKISNNNRFAVTASQTLFATWDLALGKSEGLWSISDGQILDIALANNGQHIALALSNGKAIYVNLATGRRMEFLAHRETVNTIDISQNGKYILSGGNDHNAYLWDTTTGQIIYKFAHDTHLNKVKLQKDGKVAFTSDSGNNAKIWDLSTGHLLSKLQSYSRQLIFSSARFSNDGKFLLTGSPNRQISVWDTKSGNKLESWIATEQKDTRPPRAVIYDVAFAEDGNIISASSAGIVQKWLFK